MLAPQRIHLVLLVFRPDGWNPTIGVGTLAVAVLPAEHLAGERHGDPAPYDQRGAVERSDDAARRREGALHVVEQEDDDVLADGELTVGKQLEQYRPDQRIIGRQYGDVGQGEKSRAEVR